MYNYNHLYYFYTTVKCEGVTLAAKHLHISQPSLSGQLRVLEDFLQIKLFTKVGRKNQLTPEGAMVYGFCRRMFEISEQMHETLADQEPSALRKIYVGISEEIASSFVVEVISHFLSKYDEHVRPRIVMITGDHESLSEQIRFREIDLVVSSFASNEPDLANVRSIEVPVNLLCKLDERIEQDETDLDIKTILNLINNQKEIGWVMPQQGTRLRSEINSFFEDNDIKGYTVFESDISESLTRSVVDSVGLAFLPTVYAYKEVKDKSVDCLGPEKGFWQHRIWVTSHVNNKDDNLINSISQSFKDVCK